MAFTQAAHLFPGEIRLLIKGLQVLRSDYEGTSTVSPEEIAVIKVTEQYLNDVLCSDK